MENESNNKDDTNNKPSKNCNKSNNNSSKKRKKYNKQPKSKRNKLLHQQNTHEININSNNIIELKNLSDTNFFQDYKSSSNTGSSKLDSSVIKNAKIRVIKPYIFEFQTYTKGRWINSTLLDVYCREFGSYPRIYYKAAIERGLIKVKISNRKNAEFEVVSPEFKLKGGEVLRHTVCRHEPAVMLTPSPNIVHSQVMNSSPIEIVHDSSEVLVINKPPTIPLHPCGAYNLNSVVHLLEKHLYDNGSSQKLFMVHRLDRLTSGCVVLAKSSETAKRLSESISSRKCEKIYLARVKGRFPLLSTNGCKRLKKEEACNVKDGEFFSNGSSSAEESSMALGYWITNSQDEITDHKCPEDLHKSSHSVDEILSSLRYISATSTDAVKSEVFWMHLACPCRIASHKDGVCEAGKFNENQARNARAAQTAFSVVHYDEETDTTVVLAKPITGRTHQIRLHLQYLKHPIANDPNYGGEIIFGSVQHDICSFAKKGLTNNKSALCNTISEEPSNNYNNLRNCQEVEDHCISDVPATEAEICAIFSPQEQGPLNDDSKDNFIKKYCVWCARQKGFNERSVLELFVRSQGIWLHALQYKLEDQTYRTDLPAWSTFTD